VVNRLLPEYLLIILLLLAEAAQAVKLDRAAAQAGC
jgi:hypothetical protein